MSAEAPVVVVREMDKREFDSLILDPNVFDLTDYMEKGNNNANKTYPGLSSKFFTKFVTLVRKQKNNPFSAPQT